MSRLETRIRNLEDIILKPKEDDAPSWWNLASEHLTEDQQNLLGYAEIVDAEGRELVRTWFNLSIKQKQSYPFYKEYTILRPIVRSAWLAGWLLNEEKNKVLLDAASLVCALRREYDPTFQNRGIHQ